MTILIRNSPAIRTSWIQAGQTYISFWRQVCCKRWMVRLESDDAAFLDVHSAAIGRGTSKPVYLGTPMRYSLNHAAYRQFSAVCPLHAEFVQGFRSLRESRDMRMSELMSRRLEVK